MFRQKPPMQLLTDGWWEKLLPNQKADAPCDVNPNPTTNNPIVIKDSSFNIDLSIRNYPILLLNTKAYVSPTRGIAPMKVILEYVKESDSTYRLNSFRNCMVI
jgi:hypothetical protein